MHDPQNKNIGQYSKHSKKFRLVFIATGQRFEFFYFDLPSEWEQEDRWSWKKRWDQKV